MAKRWLDLIIGHDAMTRLPVVSARLLHMPALLRSAATRARRAGNGDRDLFYRRQACRAAPGDTRVWLQYGHSLKEAGFFDRARLAYARASELAPEDPSPVQSLAHLAKMDGDMAAAKRHFAALVPYGPPLADEAQRELALLGRVDNTVIYPERVGEIDPGAVHIYLSAPPGAVVDRRTGGMKTLGRADYSYGFAMRGFHQALELLGMPHSVIRNPEAVTDIRERSNAAHNIHLAFYPPERIRLLKGAYNVACFAWEFDRLRSIGETLSYHAFSDQKTMLTIVDEVWVPSRHGAGALRRDVPIEVKAVPSPILGNNRAVSRSDRPTRHHANAMAAVLRRPLWQPLAILQRVQGTMNEASFNRALTLPDLLRRLPQDTRPTFYMTVLNVHDWRKQLKPMLEGFIDHSRRHREAYLLIKLTSPHAGTLSVNDLILGEQISDPGELALPLVSERILITRDILTQEELNALYDLSSFYVCTSFAEGQNLPILEAMGRGAVPVSVDHTAMQEYVSDRTGVIIPSFRQYFDRRMSSRYSMYGLETNFVKAVDVSRSLASAEALTPGEYVTKAAAARDIVAEDFGLAPVRAALTELVSRLCRTGAA